MVEPGSAGPPDAAAADLAPRRATVERDLRRLLTGDVEFDAVSRVLYATDAGLNQIQPLGVVSPRDTEDVARLVAYASAHGLPLVPRGMGSGLAGGAVGSGIQVDFTRHMNRVLEVAPDGSWARVQPGLTMGRLNRHMKEYGTFFAPDPSSENYCSLGGMCGTNSSGSRSVAYGSTKDHVLSLELIMADGRLFTARSFPRHSPELAQLLNATGIGPGAAKAVLAEIEGKRELIAASLPRVVKNCSGYRVEAVVDEEGTTHLQRLFVGAEGTLGLVTEITVKLVPLPPERGIAMVYFPSVYACGEAVTGILALSPSAVEIMDSRFLELVRNRYSQIDAMLPPRTDTAVLVEFEGLNKEELDARFADLRNHLDSTQAIQVVRPRNDEETARLWHMRKSAVALMQRTPGPRKPLPFIEDVTVHPLEVARYIDFLQRLFGRHGLDAVMVGHVGDGNVHTRPLLDPKDPGDLKIMQAVYEEVSDYVLSVRGTMSGEHGDGLVRSPYIRRMYGAEVYALFERLKAAFDPQCILNPGKKITPQEAGATLPRYLRFDSGYLPATQKSVLHFPGEAYQAEIEKCHGCGQCKSMVGTTMCPTYKATSREHASPRAKANLLRGIATGVLDPGGAYGWASTRMVTDYCIVCGMCAVECPSNVNIPKLMLEAKSRYRAARRAGRAEMILGRAERVSEIGQRFAPLSNRIANQRVLRALAQPLIGIDRRRNMATFAGRSLQQLLADRSPQAGLGQPTPAESADTPSIPRAAYFYDLFANYNEPGIALAVEKVLNAHGVEVLFPEQRGSGVPEMLNGFARMARDAAEFNVRSFLPYAQAGAALVGSEPTASFAFKVHYPDYVNSRDCSTLANAFRDLGEYLVRYRADHPERSPTAARLEGLSADYGVNGPGARRLRVAYHLPCHLRAQQIGSPSLALLGEIPGLELIDVDSGCCGMAGTFGMKARSYDLSMLAGKPLFDRVGEISPNLVVTECSTCRMQIGRATGLRTLHPITLLADAYGLR